MIQISDPRPVVSATCPPGNDKNDWFGRLIGKFVCFAGGEGNSIPCFQIVRTAVDDHACGAFEDDEQFVHVGVRVGGEDFARRDHDARDLGEWRQFAFAEPYLFLCRWIVTNRLFRRAVDAAEMHRGGRTRD